MKSMQKPRRKPPHLFAKIIIVWCVVCATVFSAVALATLYRTGNDATGILGVALGFFGGELLFIAMRTIFKERKRKNDDPDEHPPDDWTDNRPD